MEIKSHTRRPPQPSIDPALVVPGSRWQKNRAIHHGQPPVFIVVDGVEEMTTTTGVRRVVHYHYEDQRRSKRHSMPLVDFVKGSEHKAPDPQPLAEEPAPDSGVQTANTTEARLAAIESTQKEILAILRNAVSGPLFARAR